MNTTAWATAAWRHRNVEIALLAGGGIALHLLLRLVFHASFAALPLLVVLVLGGGILVWELLGSLWRREFGSDLLAGLSIVTSVVLGEYLAGSIIVLMLSGGETLEGYAVRRASSVLDLLARRMPSRVHFRRGAEIVDGPLEEVAVGDELVVFPHETCPADAEVVEGRGSMDESYLTGEPFRLVKIPGAAVISGAINGDSALVVRAVRRPVDSRYAKIMEVMRESAQRRPRIRRLGDRLGAIYTPVAVAVALLAWFAGGDASRFLAVLVIATPCPLLIGIPVAIIGAISLAARRGIIVKNAAVLEQATGCRTAIFDKTGTLTYGEPKLVENVPTPGFDAGTVLRLTAALERYSRHPLARAVLAAAGNGPLPEAVEVGEVPGQGLRGTVDGRSVLVTSRGKLLDGKIPGGEHLPPTGGGLECVVVVDGRYAALFRFRDAPRVESSQFVRHLGKRHQFRRLLIVSGDREGEVRYLAEQVGIGEIHARQSPEEKVAIVRAEAAKAPTLYVGDGINDAPAMMQATVGIAIGQSSDVTAEAADVVILESSLRRVDEFLHISRRMVRIALQSAVGGMALSVAGMGFAAAGHLSPVEGALLQEAIDVLAVLNALRAAVPPRRLSDC